MLSENKNNTNLLLNFKQSDVILRLTIAGVGGKDAR